MEQKRQRSQMSTLTTKARDIFKARIIKKSSYTPEDKGITYLPRLPRDMVQALLGTGLCPSATEDRWSLLPHPFWSVSGDINIEPLGMLFGISNSKILVDAFNINDNTYEGNNVTCYASRHLYLPVGNYPIYIGGKTNRFVPHPTRKDLDNAVMSSLFKLAAKMYAMWVVTADGSRWPYRWDADWFPHDDGRVELLLKRMSSHDLIYEFSVDANLIEVTQDNGDVKDVLSISMKKKRINVEPSGEFQYIAERIANPLIEVGYDVNSCITYDDEVVQEIVVNIDVTTSTTAWDGASSCRFFQDLETILREVTPARHKPLFILESESNQDRSVHPGDRTLCPLKAIASEDDDVAQSYYDDAMKLAEKTIQSSVASRNRNHGRNTIQ
jgi:hypothetical protein